MKGFEVNRDAKSFPLVDQGIVHGLVASWNPDDEKFYIHTAGTSDGTNVLGRFKRWSNAVYFAKQKSLR